MNALLGKIVHVLRRRGRAENETRSTCDITFTPVCVMPERTPIPEWLKDQKLTITRTVEDIRELGGTGDSLVLTPEESAKWLFPLTIEPQLCHGKLPGRLKLRLHWWKTKKPGEITITTNGICRRVKWSPSVTGKEKKSGKCSFEATVQTKHFFTHSSSLPVRFEASFDKLKTACTVLPAAPPMCATLPLPSGNRHRLESIWYSVDICPDHGGGICSLTENARKIDHFGIVPDRIQETLELTGHLDRAEVGWSDRLGKCNMVSAGHRIQEDGPRWLFEGVVDEERNIRTTVQYHAATALPLVAIRRELLVLKGKDNKDKDKKGPPEELRDTLVRIALGFRTACPVAGETDAESRIVSIDRGRFATIRHSREKDVFWRGWPLREGWIVLEQLDRKRAMLFLFDRRRPPRLVTQQDNTSVTVEGHWPPQPVAPENGFGFTLGIVSGEMCGADENGAWVACRRVTEDGTICVGVVGRFREIDSTAKACIHLGTHEQDVPVQTMSLDGIGAIAYAEAMIAGASTNSPLKVEITGIDSGK